MKRAERRAAPKPRRGLQGGLACSTGEGQT